MARHPLRYRLPWPFGWSRARKSRYALAYVCQLVAEGLAEAMTPVERRQYKADLIGTTPETIDELERHMAREHDDHRNYNHSDHMTNDDAESNGSAGTTSPQDSHEGE